MCLIMRLIMCSTMCDYGIFGSACPPLTFLFAGGGRDGSSPTPALGEPYKLKKKTPVNTNKTYEASDSN